MVRLCFLQPLESLHVLLQIGVHTDPVIVVACLVAAELRICFVVGPLGRFELLLLQKQNGEGWHQCEMLFSNDADVEVLVWIFVHRGDGFVVAQPQVLGVWVSSFEKLFGDVSNHILRDFVAEGLKLLEEIAILMLDVRSGIRVELLMIEKVLQTTFFFMRFDEILSADAVSEPVGGQRNRVLLILETLGEILRLCPTLENIITFEDISDDARYVFGHVLLIEPLRVEPDLFPRYLVDLRGQPHFG